MLERMEPERVFYYFEKISAVPRGSGNMKGIADYCESFAVSHNLKYKRDMADNIVIYKTGSAGYEKSEPIILQGHLDMVCQKTKDCDIDFEKDGIDIYTDGDYVKARNTTLGADNGIAVAMILAVLESDEYAHPPIEAVFTTDEEVGMLGALKLDMSDLNAHRMINLDSEESAITVSCAGGADFNVCIPYEEKEKSGTEVEVEISGLKGGHSGVEINSGRVNANLLMGRILDTVNQSCDFDIISINGGDKSNAIPNGCAAKLCVNDTELFADIAEKCIDIIKKEIVHREPEFDFKLCVGEHGKYTVADEKLKENLLAVLVGVPNGVVEMSAEIDGLVETSLNMGILKTSENKFEACISMRSNKKSAQNFLKRRLEVLFGSIGAECSVSGYYPPWEYNDGSKLCGLYADVYYERYGEKLPIEAIHAGLECGVFSSQISNADCISVGPKIYDVHTVNERLSISSTQKVYETLIVILSKLK